MLKKECFKWFVVKIKPNSYDLANRNLKRQSFKTFHPVMKITIRKNNRFITKEVSVFPGYIFVSFDPICTNWHSINSTYGVSQILCFNSKPAEISSDLILQLMKKYNLNQMDFENSKLQQGDLIKIEAGPFTNFFAKIENVDKSDRIWLLLDYNGRKQRVNFKNDINFKFVSA